MLSHRGEIFEHSDAEAEMKQVEGFQERSHIGRLSGGRLFEQQHFVYVFLRGEKESGGKTRRDQYVDKGFSGQDLGERLDFLQGCRGRSSRT